MPGFALACAANSGDGGKRRLLFGERFDRRRAHARDLPGDARMPAENVATLTMLPHSFSPALTALATGLTTIAFDAPRRPIFVVRAPRSGERYLSDLRGKTVVIDFWACWCHVCTAELRDFVRRARDLRRTRRRRDGLDRTARCGRQLPAPVEHPSAAWSKIPTGSISQGLLGSEDPRHARPGRPGHVCYVSVGEMSWHELSGAIERVACRLSRLALSAPEC